MDRCHPSSAKRILQGAEIFHGNIKSDSSRGQEDHMHDGNQRYKIHIRPHGRHRGKGPAMPRLKAPCGHREIQSRHKVQRREMRQAPPPREMARSRQAEAHRMHPVHVSLTRMRHGTACPATGGQPHGAELAAIFPHTVFGTFLPGKWSRESYGERRRQGIPQRNAPHGQKEGIPTAAAREKPPPVTGFFPPGTGCPFLREEAAARQSHTPK